MANYTYKRTTTTNLKVVGTVDIENMTIEVDGEDKKISDLLSDFDGGVAEINVKIKNEEDLSDDSIGIELEVQRVGGIYYKL